MKLSASIRRTEAAQANVNNALSMLQSQDGVLKNAEKVVTRMSELIQLATDVTKSTNDTKLYQTEYEALQNQLGSLIGESFNGVSMFTNSASTTQNTSGTLQVVTSEDGLQSFNITKQDLGWVGGYVGTVAASATSQVVSGTAFGSLAGATAAISNVTTALQNLATLRANNGSEQQRITFAADLLAINKVNLESANSRIADLDIAAESANLARLNILQQAGTAMLAQANMASQSVLKLLL
jgi:flagellin